MTRTVRSTSGYSLIELMIVVCLIGILGAMATVQIAASRPGMLGDGAMRSVVAELNAAREQAITQRRNVEITFVGNNGFRVIRHNLPNGTTTLRDVSFESGVQFALISGVADTPDGFGNSAATSFGSAITIMFGSDGALIDSGGTPVNGTVFLAIPSAPLSFRAVTVLGTTGRVRGYRWNGRLWTRV